MDVLVVAAHPDDEVLGCGGSIAMHSQCGDRVSIVFMADGEGAREPGTMDRLVSERQQAACRAALHLGAEEPVFLGLPDNRMDSIPLLDVVQLLEKEITRVNPQRIYTHHGGDLNIDHRLTYQAVITGCRPQASCPVEAIYCFEVPSSTEWAGQGEQVFRPAAFTDIGPVLGVVEKALGCYSRELRPFPHPRSPEAIQARQRWRGAAFGVGAAEVFTVERMALLFSGNKEEGGQVGD